MDALGPKGTKREGLRYYATAFLAATQFGRDSSSVLEIGCASNAFVGRMAWIEKKTCVAPYHAGYANADGRNGSGMIGAASDDGVEYVGADFATWRVERAYDFCVCMQVLEHTWTIRRNFLGKCSIRACVAAPCWCRYRINGAIAAKSVRIVGTASTKTSSARGAVFASRRRRR